MLQTRANIVKRVRRRRRRRRRDAGEFWGCQTKRRAESEVQGAKRFASRARKIIAHTVNLAN